MARPAERIALLSVVGPFDRFTERTRCVLGRPVCSDKTACPAHARWKQVTELTTAFFRDTRLADLLHPTSGPRRTAPQGLPS